MSTLAPRRSARWSIRYSILWILPFLLVLVMIAHYGVDIGYWDEFEADIAGFLARSVTGHPVTWAALIAQHNESRKFFPRLLYLAVAYLTHWDLRYEMLASALTILVTSAALLYITLRTIPTPPPALLIALLTDYLLFSPVQWQNLLWGIQWIVFVPAAALAIILAVFESDMTIWLSLLIAASAAIVSTYSYANGMLVWLLAIPSLMLHFDRRRFFALAIWILLAGICAGYYFHGYVKPGSHPSLLAALHLPEYAVQFFLAFLGNGVRLNTNIHADFLLGGLSLGLWTIGVVVTLIPLDMPRFRRALPWIILGAYTIISGIITTTGRLGFGVLAANPDRYTTFALPLWASLVPLWWVACQNRPAKAAAHSSAWPMWPIWIMAFAIFAINLRGDLFVQGELGGWVADRRAARAVLQFSAAAPELGAIAELVYPDPGKALDTIAELDAAGLLHCGRFASNKIADIPGGVATGWGGTFEGMYRIGDEIVASGWASDPAEKSPPDAILLTMPDNAGAQRVVAIATDDRISRPDVVATTHHRWLRYSGWKYSFAAGRVPTGSSVSAWAYDSFNERVYRLSGIQNVP